MCNPSDFQVTRRQNLRDKTCEKHSKRIGEKDIIIPERLIPQVPVQWVKELQKTGISAKTLAVSSYSTPFDSTITLSESTKTNDKEYEVQLSDMTGKTGNNVSWLNEVVVPKNDGILQSLYLIQP